MSSTTNAQVRDPRRITSIISKYRSDLEKYISLYKHFHSHPELSFCESKTAATIASWLSKYSSPSYDIKTSIGGHGIAAILLNGDGPIVMLRADMDALPVAEQTDLPYASEVRMNDANSTEQPVMHACGHDMHVTSLLAAAELLHSARSSWSGTLVLIFQPAEEKGKGAQAMVDDGLYSSSSHAVPVPDVVLGGHVTAMRSGALGARPRTMAPACDSFRITLYGRGAHASMPQNSIDPVVMAASVIMRLQTLVSREAEPSSGCVVTVATVRAGEAENVIPDTAELKVDVRSFDEEARKRVLDGIRRVVKHEALASGAVKEPMFETLREFPILFNDENVTSTLSTSMSAHFGDAWNDNQERFSASEDFGILASAVDRPSCFWLYGGTEQALYDEKKEQKRLQEDIPGNHSARFAPVILPTLQVAVDAYVVGALTFLGDA